MASQSVMMDDTQHFELYPTNDRESKTPDWLTALLDIEPEQATAGVNKRKDNSTIALYSADSSGRSASWRVPSHSFNSAASGIASQHSASFVNETILPDESRKADLPVKNSNKLILKYKKLNPPKSGGCNTSSGMFIRERSTMNTNSIHGKRKRSAFATQNTEIGNRVNDGPLKTKVLSIDELPQPKRKPKNLPVLNRFNGNCGKQLVRRPNVRTTTSASVKRKENNGENYGTTATFNLPKLGLIPLPAPTEIKYLGNKDLICVNRKEYDANTNPWKKVPVVNEAAERIPSHRNQIDKRTQKREVVTVRSDEVIESQSIPAVNLLHGKKPTGLSSLNEKMERKPIETKKKEPTKPAFKTGKVSSFSLTIVVAILLVSYICIKIILSYFQFNYYLRVIFAIY